MNGRQRNATNAQIWGNYEGLEAVRDVGVMAGFMNFKASIFLLDSAQQLRDTF